MWFVMLECTWGGGSRVGVEGWGGLREGKKREDGGLGEEEEDGGETGS